jgi:hypothetical protein
MTLDSSNIKPRSHKDEQNLRSKSVQELQITKRRITKPQSLGTE